MMRVKIKESRYAQAIFKYGIVPLLLLLDELEQEGEFEECKIIVDAIEYCNKHLKDTEDFEPLPIKYSAEELSKIKKRFNLFGLQKKTSDIHIAFYMSQIKEMVKL